MSDHINTICKEAERSARMCYRAGEKIEDISEAIFAHIFNFAGHNPDAKSWAMNTASGIVKRIMDEKNDHDSIVNAAPQLYDALRELVDYHADDPHFYKGDEDGALSRIMHSAYDALKEAEGVDSA